MAILTVTLGPQSNSKTISAGDIARILAAAKVGYGQVLDGEVMRDRTNAELFDLIVTEFHSMLKEKVSNAETQVARANVSQLGIT